jgi:hypothetical protein
MKYWSTSESSSDVSQEFFSKTPRVGAINHLEEWINRHTAGIDAGEWHKWRVIFMIASEEHKAAMEMKETRRLTRKDMTLDFRVFVDYQQAKHADFNQCIDLLVPPLLSTLPYFKNAGIGPEIRNRLRQAVLLASEEAKAFASSKH